MRILRNNYNCNTFNKFKFFTPFTKSLSQKSARICLYPFHRVCYFAFSTIIKAHIMNQSEENIRQIDIISVVSEIIRKFERYNSSVETKNM